MKKKHLNNSNSTPTINVSLLLQVLYSEEINEFPVHKTIKLNCAFFGLVGHYALRLKPSASDSSAPTTSAYIKVILLHN